MHARSIVARVLGPCLELLHAKRAQALQRCVLGLLFAGSASLSSIALWLPGVTRLKYRLKSVDRLLSNVALHAQREALYAALARGWLEGVGQVLLVVDWSDLTSDQGFHCLRASVVVEGRSVTLYEEAQPQRLLCNLGVHRKFLDRVAKMLPAGCRPIVMTDAGFHATWFNLIVQRGWHFIGRLRGRNLVRIGEASDWEPARETYRYAEKAARDFANACYARSNPVSVRLVLAKCPAKGRHQFSTRGGRAKSRSSLKHARSANEPWLLACSPGLEHLSAAAIVALYAQRMRIEESFRDTKNLRWGLGLESSGTHKVKRLDMLLLLTHLVGFVERLIGESAKQRQLELQFMSTRRRSRPEISVVTLGRRIVDTLSPVLGCLRPWRATQILKEQARAACCPTT